MLGDMVAIIGSIDDKRVIENATGGKTRNDAFDNFINNLKRLKTCSIESIVINYFLL